MLDYKREYERWLASDALNADEKAELQAIAGDEKEIESRFYGPLEFGTAGLRGTMKVGLHQMNVHVIRWATQGFADVIAAEGDEAKQKGVAICMDCRVNSMAFARAAAEVCAANGIRVRIFESLRPTPELSFAVRYYGCQAGINVTASHNPKEYNGYKVYWADGAQLPPQHAAAIAARLEQIDIFTGVKRMAFDDAVKAGLITLLGEETDKMFMSNVMAMINDRASVAQVADSFKVVYTPFHGCGWKLVPEALRGLGVKNLYCVEQQMVLDGTFPTVASPNPENPEGFYLAIELADKVGADFILGTDPDSDRVGIMVRGADGKFIAVTGGGIEGVGKEHFFSSEKLTTLLTLFKYYGEFENALTMMQAMFNVGGKGHSCGIYSFDDDHIHRLGMCAPVSRIMVRQPNNRGNSGSSTNGMPPTSSMGCGTWGGNIVSENICLKHYMNTTWVARPLPEDMPSNEELFGEFNKPDMDVE